jgi:hypothetical protein
MELSLKYYLSLYDRRPVQYYSIDTPIQEREHHERTRATINRLKYYSKLDPRRNSTMVPYQLFIILKKNVQVVYL